jgi:hypothetical protein
MFSCETITPLGSIVDPDVYCRNRISKSQGKVCRRSYPRSLPSQSREDWRCSRCLRRTPRLHFWQIGLQRCAVVTCSSRSRPLGNPLRCGPFCTGRSGNRGSPGDRQARESIRRARNQKTRRSSRGLAGRRAKPVSHRETMLFPQVTGNRLRPVQKRRVGSSTRWDCRSGQDTNREVCLGAYPRAYPVGPKSTPYSISDTLQSELETSVRGKHLPSCCRAGDDPVKFA